MLRKKIYELPKLSLFLSKFIFSLLTILDVRACRVPAKNVSCLIEQRIVLDQEPPVLAVFPQGSLFNFERKSPCESGCSLVLQALQVVWVEDPFAKGGSHDIFRRQPGIVQRRLV